MGFYTTDQHRVTHNCEPLTTYGLHGCLLAKHYERWKTNTVFNPELTIPTMKLWWMHHAVRMPVATYFAFHFCLKSELRCRNITPKLSMQKLSVR